MTTKPVTETTLGSLPVSLWALGIESTLTPTESLYALVAMGEFRQALSLAAGGA